MKMNGWLKGAKLNRQSWEICGRSDMTSESRDLIVGGYREHASRMFQAQRFELIQVIADLRAKQGA